jgi:glycosyltransferase involved in cell wall biosynthesis
LDSGFIAEGAVRVVHVLGTVEPAGGSEHLSYLVHGLRQYGFDSVVVAGRGGPAVERLRASGFAVQVLGPMGVGAPIRLLRVFRDLRPDLLHLHGSRAGLVGTLAAVRAGIRPIVYTAHAFAFKRRLSPPLRWLVLQADRFTCCVADRIICLTAADRQAAIAHGLGAARYAVIPNGVAVSAFTGHTTRRAEFGFDSDVPVIGMVARLVPDKDPAHFVAVAADVCRVIPEARFLLVGDGPLRPEVDRAARQTGIRERLVMTGFRQDIPELLATMDVVVLTSQWEAMPMALLEAMAAGRPVVAPALPGLAEVIVDGATGYLVAGDKPDLATAIVALIRDPGRRRAMGQRARQRVQERFDVGRMVEATARVYQEALAPRVRHQDG